MENFTDFNRDSLNPVTKHLLAKLTENYGSPMPFISGRKSHLELFAMVSSGFSHFLQFEDYTKKSETSSG